MGATSALISYISAVMLPAKAVLIAVTAARDLELPIVQAAPPIRKPANHENINFGVDIV